MIIHKSFDCQNGNYKLTSQCENTISSVFTLLQSNNTLLIQNLNKFRNWAGGGQESLVGGGAAAPCPTAGYGPGSNSRGHILWA